jgi:hypothetical protein
MQHQFSSSDEPTTSVFVSESNPMVQARIDAYLDRTCAPLFRSLPQDEAVEQRAEMRSHLENMIAAYVELGSSETLAVTQTLEQFGREQSIAQAWQQECDTVKVEAGRGTFWFAIRPVVGFSAVNWMVLPMMLEVYAFLTHGYFETGRALPAPLTAAAFLVFCAEYALFPGFLGFLAGRRTRGKTLAASLLALPIIQLLCMAPAALIYHGLHSPLFSPHSLSEMLGGTTLAFCVNFLGCGVLGAGIAQRRRKRAMRLAGNR